MPLTVVVNEKRYQGRGATSSTGTIVGTTMVYQSFGTPVGAGRKVWHACIRQSNDALHRCGSRRYSCLVIGYRSTCGNSSRCGSQYSWHARHMTPVFDNPLSLSQSSPCPLKTPFTLTTSSSSRVKNLSMVKSFRSGSVPSRHKKRRNGTYGVWDHVRSIEKGDRIEHGSPQVLLLITSSRSPNGQQYILRSA